MPETIKIAVIDDHELFVEGLCNIIRQISPNFIALGYSSAQALFSSLENNEHYDLIVSDLAMKGMNGLALISALRANKYSVPVIITSGIVDNNSLSEENLKKHGASAFVHKTAGRQQLEERITEVLSSARDRAVSEPMSKTSKNTAYLDAKAASKITLPTLGVRQLEVLKLTADGMSNREIADTLSISENTVKSHLQTIFNEFDVSKRTACVKLAREFGII